MVQPSLRLSTLTIGDVIDGRYEVRGHLGSGGMGDVWLVQHRELLQSFALKTLKPEIQHSADRVQRFVREARAAAALHSRYIVRVVDGRTDYLHHGVPLPFIVMEHLQGVSLEQRIALYGPCSPAEACWLLARLGRALRAAHANGLVHRDVKPANVFIANGEDGEPTVKLGDFGVVKLMDEGLWADSAMTASGTLIGTPMYMAPEQLRGQRAIGPEADQWSFAMVAYYLLAGDCYFSESESMADLIAAALGSPWLRPSRKSRRFPPALDGWFLRSCHQAPEERFKDVEQQAREFGRLLGNPKPIAIVPRESGTIAEPGASPSLRPMSWWGLGAGVLVAVAVTGWIWLNQGKVASWLFQQQASSMLSPQRTNASSPAYQSFSGQSTPAVRSSVPGPVSAGVAPSALGVAEVQAPVKLESAATHASKISRAPGGGVAPAVVADGSSFDGRVAHSTTQRHNPRVPAAPRPALSNEPSPVSSSAKTTSESLPQVSSRRPSAASCSRSAECHSGLCVAEVCR